MFGQVDKITAGKVLSIDGREVLRSGSGESEIE
jgi:hypothetical protein